MSNTMIAEPPQQTFTDDYDRMVAELMKIAEEKPTLRMIHSQEAKAIEEWQELYPELALYIEVTKEDFSKIYEGKLIATAESSIEFLDLDKDPDRRDVVHLTTYGKPIGEQPILLPAAFWL